MQQVLSLLFGVGYRALHLCGITTMVVVSFVEAGMGRIRLQGFEFLPPLN